MQSHCVPRVLPRVSGSSVEHCEMFFIIIIYLHFFVGFTLEIDRISVPNLDVKRHLHNSQIYR